MINLDEMRKLAERATPGPWEPCLGSGHHECTAIHFEGNEQYPYGLFVCDLLPDWLMDEKYKTDVSFKSANMDYLCAANPATVLALLDVVEAARRCAERGYPCPHCDLGYEEDTCSCFDSISEKKEHIAGLKDTLARLDGKEK